MDRDMTLEDCRRDWTDAELEALPRGSSMWNPFAAVWMETKDSRADTLLSRWSYIHDGRYCTGIDDPENRDPLDHLIGEATLRQSGVRVVRHPENNQVVAVFPNVPANPSRQDELAWEERAKAMHQNQGTVTLPDYPEPPRRVIADGVRPTFYSLMSDPIEDIPNFADLTPEQRKKLGHK